MKFKDAKGNVFIPTNPTTEEEMRKSPKYQEIKEKKEVTQRNNEQTNEQPSQNKK